MAGTTSTAESSALSRPKRFLPLQIELPLSQDLSIACTICTSEHRRHPREIREWETDWQLEHTATRPPPIPHTPNEA